MINYKQIAVIKGPAAAAIEKANDEDRSFSFRYVKEGRKTVLIVSAEIKWREELTGKELLVR
jgi:plasmid replication initiation protein